MKETFIDILGLHILEPVTVLTDVLLSIFCIYFYNKLNFQGNKPLLGKYWRLFFLFIGLATFIGAISHGLKSYFSLEIHSLSRMIMCISSIPASYYLLKATIELSDKNKTKYSKISLIAMCVLTIFTMLINNFILIVINAVVVISITLIIHYRTYKKGYIGSGYIVAGFAFSLSSVIVHLGKLSINDWVTFRDISHIIMNIGLYIIFTGVLLKTKTLQAEQQKA